MTNWELPLVLFTVLSQAAVGAIVFSAVLEPQVAPEHGQTRRALRMAGAIAFPLLVVSLIASLFHLGQPLVAFRALRHVGSAWLSREILFFGITTVLSAVYGHMCYHNKEGRNAFGYLTGFMGLISVWSSAMVYALPARAVWSPVLNTLAFFGTAALLGALVVAVLNQWYAAGESQVVARAAGGAMIVGGLLTVAALAGTGLDQGGGIPVDGALRTEQTDQRIGDDLNNHHPARQDAEREQEQFDRLRHYCGRGSGGGGAGSGKGVETVARAASRVLP